MDIRLNISEWAINVNDLVQLQSNKASGFFRVKNIKISGDNLEATGHAQQQLWRRKQDDKRNGKKALK